jgi:ribosomal protein L16 Arg81 hydroxylase
MASAEAHNALAALTTELGLPVSAAQWNGYISPPDEGVPWHFDDREVIVVQMQGSKRWTVAVNREVRYPTSNFVLATRSPGEDEAMSSYGPREFVGPRPDDRHDLLLEPGSVIFLPSGTWHTTYASEASFSLTFGFFLPTALDVLLDAVRRRYVVDERYRRPLNHASPVQRDQAMAWLVELVNDWQQDVSRHDPRDLLEPGKAKLPRTSRPAPKQTAMPERPAEQAQATSSEPAQAPVKKAARRTRTTPSTTERKLPRRGSG